MNFKNYSIVLDSVKAGSKVTLVYEKTDECKPIKELRGCFCTNIQHNEKDITGIWTVGSEYVAVVKNIIVTYTDESQEILSVKANVVP